MKIPDRQETNLTIVDDIHMAMSRADSFGWAVIWSQTTLAKRSSTSLQN